MGKKTTFPVLILVLMEDTLGDDNNDFMMQC